MESLGSVPTGSLASQHQQQAGTLDEPVRETIMRDVNAMKEKFKFVLFPSSDSGERISRDWDLWGPFILCLVLSVVLATQAPENQKGYVFALVYICVWAGSAVATLNAALLKANISLFQTVCVLGYSFFPLVLSALAGWLVNRILVGTPRLAIKATVIGVALVWSTKTSVGFMSGMVPEDKKTLAVYPVWLLYIAMSWIILLS
jgi:hypothetical protein